MVALEKVFSLSIKIIIKVPRKTIYIKKGWFIGIDWDEILLHNLYENSPRIKHGVHIYNKNSISKKTDLLYISIYAAI